MLKRGLILICVVLCLVSKIQAQNLSCPANIDFEKGNFSSWYLYTGSCCPIVATTLGQVSGRHTITSGSGVDPYGGFPIVPAGGGTYALKLGNSSTGAQAEKARYYVRVPKGVSNYSLIYRYAVVFQDPNHVTADQPRFEVKAYDSATNKVITCANFSYIASSSIPGFTQSGSGSNVFYKGWSTSTINLSGYAGKTVIIDFASGDCKQGGHFGYGYVDLSCGLFKISSVVCNGAPTSTLTAPPGYKTYDWRDSSMKNKIGSASTITINTPTVKTKYYVILTPYDGFGCPDTLTTEIDVTIVKSKFTIPDSTKCLRNNLFQFNNTSTASNGFLTYAWNFGDGAFSTSTSPSRAYTAYGNYNVRLISTANGCSDTSYKKVKVWYQAKSKFLVNDSTQCLLNNAFQLTNTNTIPNDSLTFKWDYGNGNTSTLPGPLIKYTNAGTYKVKLIVNTSHNCSDTFSRDLEVYPQPKADFSMNDSVHCLLGNNFIFTNKTAILSGSLSYNWNFGDGNTSTSANPNRKYINAGNYSVKLISSSNFACNDTITKKITVFQQPKAYFSVNDSTQCFRSNKFIFTNKSKILSDSLSYRWDMGNGHLSIQKNITESYIAHGAYTTKLIVFTMHNCADTFYKPIEIYPQPLSAFSIKDSLQCLRNNEFQFTNKSSIDWGNLNYNWSFGNGASSSQTNPKYNYLSHNTYKVRLIAGTAFSCFDTSSQYLTVYPQPKAYFSVNDSTQCLLGNNFDFTNKSSVLQDSLDYTWYLGTEQIAIIKNIVQNFSTHNNYIVKLIANTNNLCKDTFSKPIEIYPMPLTDFSINDSIQCLKKNMFQFTNKSNIDWGALNYSWLFGDGNNSTSKDPSHAYSTYNDYPIRLITGSAYQCYDTMSSIVTVLSQPLAFFTVNDSTQCLRNNEFIFTNKSKIQEDTIAYKWFVGSSDSSNNKDLNRKFQIQNTFIVSLFVQTGQDCRDSFYKAIEIYPQPKSVFTIDKPKQCLLSNKFQFSNNSNIAYGTYTNTWEFGDGSGSVQNSPAHIYSANNSYKVTLVTNSIFNCNDTMFKYVDVFEKPNAEFKLNDTTQCLLGNSFIIKNISHLDTGSFKCIWNFGDGDSSKIFEPVHQYKTFQLSKMRLIVSSLYNCNDTFFKPVEIYPQPVSAFGINDSTQCLLKNTFSFYNNSSINYGTLNYFWSFGNGDLSIATDPIYTYPTHNTYFVKLISVSPFNCQDTAVKQLFVYPQPKAQFTINDSTQCHFNNVFKFTNKSSIAGGNLNYVWYFGNGDSTNKTDEVYKYNANGAYISKLLVRSEFNCTDTAFKPLEVYPRGKLEFSTDTVCLKMQTNLVSLSAIASGVFASIDWDFGDGNTGNGSPVNHVYNKPGFYTVSLRTTSDQGCTDTLVKKDFALVRDLPKALFNNSQVLDSFPLVGMQFRDASITDNILKYFWSFDVHGNSVYKDPYKIFTDTGNMKVSLLVQDIYGCSDIIEKEVWVMPSYTFFMPTAFTCNDDELNDLYLPFSMPFVKTYKMEIFNMWGAKLFSCDDSHTGWDGTYNGTLCPQGVYICLIKVLTKNNEVKTYKTTFTLLR